MIKERIGIIDIGTNTFNLLVVDRMPTDFEKVFSTKVGVGLGLGGINEGHITDEAMSRGIKALTEFLRKSRELGVVVIKALATSAVRDARNKDTFLQYIREQLGLSIEVISGPREAELIYKGVRSGYTFKKKVLIMDIGGGSSEFIYANKTEVIKSQSFNIGTARIYQLFDFEDPYSDKNITTVVHYLESNTKGFFDDIETDILVGASGSFETFYAILRKIEYPENEFEDMNAIEVLGILESMISSTLEERMKNEFIIPIREKMAPIAAIKIKWVLEKLNIKTLTISPFSMKEGVLQMI